MQIRQGILELTPREDRTRNLPIDFFLSSLAEDQRSRSIGVILSGAASDGTLGLEAIRAASGITFAQDSSAKFDGMPRSAIAAGVVDYVLPPDAIAREIAGVKTHPHFGTLGTNPPVEDSGTLDMILSLLHLRKGVNFAHYKRPTVIRRISRRMAVNHIETSEGYLGLIEERPAELDLLFDDLLITVTEFFRDPGSFEVLAEKAFPVMLTGRGRDETIRVWVPGCSSGHEVYTLAILLTEYLEETRQTAPVQLFGTDVSESSIAIARLGRYPTTIATSISPERLSRFFLKVEDGFQVTRSIREICVFSRHDITRDPPLSKMDLISSRNMLIYMSGMLQRRVLSIFVYALRNTGCLFLGKSESPGSLAEYFAVIDSKHKIYRKTVAMGRPDLELPARLFLPEAFTGKPTVERRDDGAAQDRQADRMLLEEYAPSGFLINEREQVVKFRGEVGPYLSPPAGDPEFDIFKLIRLDVAMALRSALEEAKNNNSTARRDQIQLRRNGGFDRINLIVRPVGDSPGQRYFLVLFEEPAQQPRPAATLTPAGTADITPTPEYQSLMAELTSTRAYMQRLVEELRSANEEAQSSNEELQSINEELQTAKEELQSSNEELITTNEEMQSRNRELSLLNNDLANILSSMQMPIVMLSRDMRIRRYTPLAEAVLNLIPADIGRPISDLKPRIYVPDLEELIGGVIDTMEPLEREVQHEQGRWYCMRIQPYRTSLGRVEGAVLQLSDIDEQKRSMEEVKQGRDFAEAIIETVREPLLVLDQHLRIQKANHAFYETFAASLNDIAGTSIYELGDGRWNLPKVSHLLNDLLAETSAVNKEAEVEYHREDLGLRTYCLSARHLQRKPDTGLILLTIEDISDRKRAAEAKYRRLFEAAKDGILIIDAGTGEATDVNPYLLELLGLDRAEVVGKRFWETDSFPNLQNGPELLARLQKEKIVRFPEVFVKAKGDRHDLFVEVVANIYDEGSNSVAQFNIRDITERKHFDRRFQDTARLESLGILAGGIAHDFNNLLAGILGNAGLALGEAPPGSTYQSALKDVVLASQRAADLTRQMLAYAGKGHFLMRSLDLSDLVKEISKLVNSSIPKSVELKLNLSDSLPPIEGDSGQMQQVIMNLVINAAEAVGEGRRGQVRVVTRLESLNSSDLRLKYGTADLKAGRYVVLEITDDGCGMDESIRARIFDPFFTTKFTGRGLGLAAVQGIVRGHNGAIRVDSEVGRGTTFELALPAIEEVQISSAPVPPPDSLRGTGLILVVDDEEIVLRTSRAILEHNGYRVITASNGALGVEAVRVHKGELAAVILDLTMPVMGGDEALGRIKEIAPALPVILASGYDASQAVGRFQEDALAGFIHKPSTVTNLLQMVKAAILKR